MQAPQNPFYGSGLIVLYEYLIDAGRFKILILIGFHKIPSGIFENLRCDDF